MNPFLKTCGATGPLQLTVECPGMPGVETVEFDQPFVLIGRDPSSDLHFPHADVSERHVYLQVVGGHLCYVDLGSRAGTYLEGRCLRSGWLPLRKTLRIGPYRIRLVGGIAEERAECAGPAAGAVAFGMPPLKDAGPAPLTLEVSHRGIRSSTCPIHGELTLVGSSADCDVRVLDPSVSNYHASLLHTPDGIWVVDLLGLAGVTVNGDTVRSARVDDGDALRIGQSLVRVRYGLAGQEQGGTEEPAPAEPPANLLPVSTAEITTRTGLLEPLPPAVVDAFLSPLVDQFRLMQRELCEQLRHELSEELSRAGAELLRELSAAHDEQAQALKRELDHFQRLNQELDTLKAELAARAVASDSHDRPSVADRPARLGTVMAVPLARPFTLNTEGAFTLARPDHDNGHDTTDEAVDRQDPPVTVEEAQSWLYQRISMIQDEQQGRWQKLLSRLAV